MSSPPAGPFSAHVLALVLLMLVPFGSLKAEHRYWVGGNGHWNDRAHWSATDGGAGGAAVPGPGGDAFVFTAAGDVVVVLAREAEVGSLSVEGRRGQVRLEGTGGRLRIAGNVEVKGNVAWSWPGTMELLPRTGIPQLDLHGIPLSGDVVFSGGGTWSMRSDLVLGESGALRIVEGTLVTNGNMLRAGTLHMAGQGAKLMAGSSVVLLAQGFEHGHARAVVDAGSSTLLVAGSRVEWGTAAIAQAEVRHA